MSALLETLVSYVPNLIARRLAENPAPITAPTAERFPAAVLFADVTGFTALTERLAQRGPAGVEELTAVLKDYFEPLVATIYENGGDVVKFAGDALLSIWPAEDIGLPTVTGWAAQCGLAIQERLRNYQTSDGTPLAVRVGVACGEVSTMHIGGEYGRWEFVVAGAPLVQVSLAEHHALPSQVVLAPEAWGLVQNYFAGNPIGDGCVHLDTFHSPLPIRVPVKPHLTPEAETALKAYIPGAILARIAAGLSGWIAELRRITVIFVNLPDLNHNTPLAQAQAVMHGLQEAVYHYEGSINKLSVDDKGVTLVAALGLPPLAHENDPVRGVQAALEMKRVIDELGWRCGIGVVTGQTFCGAVGSKTRREYTMLGDVVNLAARLMQVAPGNILCETATFQATQADIEFETLPAVMVKGKAEPIPVYRPLGPRKAGMRVGARPEIVGRTAERTLLAEQIQALQRGGPGATLIIEGEAGIGKSRLVDDLRRQAEAMRVTVFVGAADAVEKSTSYYAWRRVISQLLDLEILTDAAERRRQVLDLLEDEPELLRLAPLLGELKMNLEIPDNEITASMSPQLRADNLRDLLLQLLQESASRSPKILILEDAHWLDTPSWAFAALIHQRVRPLLFVLAMRPGAEARPEYVQILNAPETVRMRLETLSPEETLILVSRRLGVTSLPHAVAALISDKAQGNPFFSEELAHALRDTGLIRITDGECLIAPEAGDLRNLNLPDTVQGVITSRIDRLTPSQQLALKVASVIGREFTFRTLSDIYPIETERELLKTCLANLQHLDLTPLDMPDPDPAYIFKHIITQEVAYNLMLFAQRRELHRAVAEWYERTQPDDLSKYYPRLAYHWSKAIDFQHIQPDLASKAIDYFEKAGEQALRNYANQEAIGFFGEALAMADGKAPDGSKLSANGNQQAVAVIKSQVSAFRRAQWERQLGEAYLNLGNLAESRQHFQIAAAALRQALPKSRGDVMASLLGQVFVQAVRRLTAFSFDNYPGLDATVQLEAARIYSGLAQIYFYASENTLNIYANLRSLNLAESAGRQSAELAHSYANVCVAAGLVPLHPVAEAYSRRARETLQNIEQLSPHHAWVYLVTAVYSAGVGQWDKTRDALDQAVDISDILGDRRRWEQSMNTLATVTYLQGEFKHSAQLSEDLFATAQRQGDVQYQVYGLLGRMRCRLTTGPLDGLPDDLEQLQALLTRKLGRVEEIMAHGLITRAQLQCGHPAAARQAADKVIRLIGQSKPISYNLIHAYAAAAETYLTLWQDRQNQWDTGLPLAAQHAVETLKNFIRVFPIGEPRAWLWQGVFEYTRGQPGAAKASWYKGLASAEKLKMPYEQGLLHAVLNLYLGDAERPPHYARASEIFNQLGAVCETEKMETQSV
jgi:class 3 adenylate cyclase/tetratricopeptide (TPR) repeat protein